MYGQMHRVLRTNAPRYLLIAGKNSLSTERRLGLPGISTRYRGWASILKGEGDHEVHGNRVRLIRWRRLCSPRAEAAGTSAQAPARVSNRHEPSRLSVFRRANRLPASIIPGPHGPEINSGSVFTVTDGNVHMAYERRDARLGLGDGVLVMSHGHVRKFSAAAVVMQSGSYHVYAPVNH